MIDINIQTKSFPHSDSVVLDDVCFSVAQQEIVAIVGPSGAGKTTLLNIVCGLDKDYQGSIEFDESSSNDALNTAFMFQEPRLMPWLTILDNVILVAEPSQTNRERAFQLLEMVGLQDRASDYPRQLSGGMQRRVALARAFLPKPKLVLMDEPFVSLDEPAAADLRKQFVKLWSESDASVLYVTHGLCEAISVSDRVLFLSKSPAKLILEQDISIKRPRGSVYSHDVQLLQKQLFQRFPDLLKGVVGENELDITA